MTTISITTICLNASQTIARCFESVASQITLPDEYIVIDGGSRDGTQALIKQAKIEGTVSKFRSEPDLGISDAFNKAWRLASGDYVATLNADDQLLPFYLDVSNEIIARTNADIVISPINFVSAGKTRTIKPNFPKTLPPKSWRHPSINHPGMIIRRSLLECSGGYDNDYKVAMDVEIFFRLLKYKPKIVTTDITSVNQYDHGKSQRDWLVGLHEMRSIEQRNNRNKLASDLNFQTRRITKIIKNKIAPWVL